MSYTEIFGFDKNGDACLYEEIHNAFRGGMAIWSFLEEKYLSPFLPDYAKKMGFKTAEEYALIIGYKPSRCTACCEPNAMNEVWDLANSDKVSETDKICLYTTFDNCLVKKENIPLVVKAFREFEGETSLKEQADVLEKMYADEDCIAVGWNQTSVNADNWTNCGEYDEETEESKPYNCLNGDKHFWLFDEVKGEENAEVKHC